MLLNNTTIFRVLVLLIQCIWSNNTVLSFSISPLSVIAVPKKHHYHPELCNSRRTVVDADRLLLCSSTFQCVRNVASYSKENHSNDLLSCPTMHHHHRCRWRKTKLFLSSYNNQQPLKNSPNVSAIASAVALLCIDILFRRIFVQAKIDFPSSLGACGFLLTTLLALPKSTRVYEKLQPGAALLAKWLPVFFVPSLITLPLADNIGSTVEILKVSLVVVGGFIVSLLASAYSVVGIRKLLGSANTASPKLIGTPATSLLAKKTFSDELFNTMLAITAFSGVIAVMSSKGLAFNGLANPLSTLFLLSATLNSFVYGARLPKKFTKLVHPLVTCTGLTWTAASVLGSVCGKSFQEVLKSYRKGGIRGIHTGAGDALLFLLGPAVVSLAISMYERRKLMRENVIEVGTSIACSTATGLFGTAFAVRSLGIVSPYLRLSLLSRNITSPLAMAIAGMLGADVSLAVSFVVVSGLIGANFGATILDAVGIRDAVARGLGIGAAAHGLGTAAFVNEPDAFPFAAIAMALTATAATITVSIPVVRNILVQVALG